MDGKKPVTDQSATTDSEDSVDSFVPRSEVGYTEEGRPIIIPPSGPRETTGTAIPDEDKNDDTDDDTPSAGFVSSGAAERAGVNHSVRKEDVHATGTDRTGKYDETSETALDD